MDKKEFERIKAEEKAHLRKLRELKQQYRGVSRQKKVLDALNAMQRPDLDETYEEAMRGLTEDAAMTEARLEIAMEDAKNTAPKPEALTDADREKLRKAEAAALIRQMKAEMGTPAGDLAASADDVPASTDTPAERTIGRAPSFQPATSQPAASPNEQAAPPPGETASEDAQPTPDRTIGRRRKPS
ncbi:MAG: hypothetical protein AAF624_06115 [Bacteroidota bacterium]